MSGAIVTLGLALVLGGVGQCPDPAHCPHGNHHHHHASGHRSGGFILPPGPGDGHGFPNGNPDGYGYEDYGWYLPLGPDRTGEYFFPRYHAAPARQIFLPSYYNPYLSSGQRYIPYTADGGDHPMGGSPLDSADLPVRPYTDMTPAKDVGPVPRLNGRVEAQPIPSGATGLTP